MKRLIAHNPMPRARLIDEANSALDSAGRVALGHAAVAAYVPVTRNLKGGRTARNAAEFRQRHVIGGF